MNRSMVMLPVVLAILAGDTGLAHAQSAWTGDRPAFDADARRQADEDEARREERRKARPPVVYPKFMQGGDRPDIKPAAPPIVYFDQKEEVGSIIVDTAGRRLFYVLPNKQAYEYPISVGRDGFTWSGTERISRIAEWPSWTPPAEMHKRVPGLPLTVTGGLKNPQGARALYLGSTIYRIHGTNNDRTVGRANSSGCFRLTNEHVVHLASIAKVGTKVKVLPSYNGAVTANAPMSSLFDLFAAAPSEPPRPSAPMAKAPAKKPVAKKPATTAAVAPPPASAPVPAPAADVAPAPKAE